MNMFKFIASFLLLFVFVGSVLADIEVLLGQEKLSSKGYDVGTIDGIMGNSTRSAIKLYQKDNNLPITGSFDEKTKLHLGIKLQKLTSEQKLKEEKYNDESRLCNSIGDFTNPDYCRMYGVMSDISYFKKKSDNRYSAIEGPPAIVCQYGVIYTNTGWKCSSMEELKSTSNPALLGDRAKIF